MSTKKDTESFEWETGKILTPKNYSPLGKVRDMGFVKLSHALPADPIQRKEERRKILLKPRTTNKDQEFFAEESSGIFKDLTPSDTSKLLRQSPGFFKRIKRFGKTPKKDNK